MNYEISPNSDPGQVLQLLNTPGLINDSLSDAEIKELSIKLNLIGAKINTGLGFEGLLAVHNIVLDQLGPIIARYVEMCWSGIGDWQG